MRTEISKDSEAYDSIMFLMAYTTPGYKIIPVSKGKPPLPSPLQLLEEGVSLLWFSPPSPGDGIYVLDPLSVVPLTHGLLVWVLCLTWPAENTIFELWFGNLHRATAAGSLPRCRERRCAVGAAGTPGAPARRRTHGTCCGLGRVGKPTSG